MKTISKTIACGIIAASCCLLLSSFSTRKAEKEETLALSCYGSEYYAVREFVYNSICDPLRKSDEKKGINMDNFSRCPSGYNAYLAGKRDSVKLDEDVFGEIKVYRGCSGVHYCDFKVNAAKNIALVKGKDSNTYVTVDEWLASHKSKVQVKKERAKEIKS